jgi:hypothetical protein
MEDEIICLFEEAQSSKRNHKSLAKKLGGQFKNCREVVHSTAGISEQLSFFLYSILSQTLLFPKSTANLQRVIDFVGLVLTYVADETRGFIISSFLLPKLQSSQKQVRLRVCQIIEVFLSVMSETGKEMDCNLLSEISEKLVIRLCDKLPVIRCAAVSALSHLQDSEDNDDFVISAFIDRFSFDSSDVVRQIIAKSLVLCDKTKTVFIQRLRDVSSEVKSCILLRFTEENVDIRQISKLSRIEIAAAVMKDRNQAVQTTGERLLLNWLSLLNNDVVRFLSYFGLVDNEKLVIFIGSLLVDKVFSDKSEDHQVEYEMLKNTPVVLTNSLSTLSPGELLWACLRFSYISRFNHKFMLSQMRSLLFCDGTNSFAQICGYTDFSKLNSDPVLQFNLKYYLQLYFFVSESVSLEFVGSSDLFAKDFLSNLLKASISFENLQSILPAVLNLVGDGRFEFLMEVYDTIVRECGSGDSESAVLSRQQALVIILVILQDDRYTMCNLPASFSFVLECLQQPYPGVRALAVSCLGVFCIQDESVRSNYLPVLNQIAGGEFEDEVVRNEALKAVTDICLVASVGGNESFEFDATFLKLLQRYDSENSYENLSMECAVKLIFTGCSKNPSIVAKLLKYFFIDSKEQNSETRINQVLSVFFHSFLVNTESCFEIVRRSLSLFISDCVTAIRDERLTHESLSEVVSPLALLSFINILFIFRSLEMFSEFVVMSYPKQKGTVS